MTNRPLAERILEAGRSGSTPEESRRLMSLERALVVKEAWDSYSGKNRKGLLRTGKITVARIDTVQNGTGIGVWLDSPTGKPTLVISNPPINVSDNRGSVRLGPGVRFREDPVMAVVRIAEGNGR